MLLRKGMEPGAFGVRICRAELHRAVDVLRHKPHDHARTHHRYNPARDRARKVRWQSQKVRTLHYHLHGMLLVWNGA